MWPQVARTTGCSGRWIRHSLPVEPRIRAPRLRISKTHPLPASSPPPVSREYIIYTDESSKTGRCFANFYGGALIRSDDLDYVREHMQAQAARMGLGAEIKWQKVSAGYLDRYVGMMDAFFDLIAADLVKIRVMFTRTRRVPELTSYHREHRYHLLYYQFLKYAFGLRYSNEDFGELVLRLHLDKLPDSKEKNALFKEQVLELQRCAEFRAASIFMTEDQISEVDSHEHLPMQCLDVVLGAVQFYLNASHLKTPDPLSKGGNKTTAKQDLCEHICARIREIHPDFIVGETTTRAGGDMDRWRHPYRHWLFTPKIKRVLKAG